MSRGNSLSLNNQAIKRKFNTVIKKRYIRIILVICIIILLLIFLNLSLNKNIKDVPEVNFSNITSIGLQYNSVKYPAVTITDSKKIKEFIDNISLCVVKKVIRPAGTGYYLSAAFYSNDERVFNILFIGNYIKIYAQGKGTQYKIVKGNISYEALDEFVRSIK
ncbi:hypothetical protein CLHOM_30440 [Clostridium homopropionicum DSM 5847]|uniref:Uncharacterized protein n=1 Tax=Clostridium homopropionicum DSM 5847 TaxID=1121318 RepID=A0A0L6Z5S4_9CLOT|nr:hypothetical protein [Clostridium homopropionicum]KOA18168.1 hypothetical protein CLHOM_30440 [Clostridium homopropionicum DSM 5847]SFF71991.1 hypothetical protein SAMN04488501_101437 [Clostridium homopropionicum]